MPPSQRWPCTVIPMFQGPRRHPMEPAAHKRGFDLWGPPLQVSGTLNGCSQVVVHIVFHISDAFYVPGGVRHKAGRMVRLLLLMGPDGRVSTMMQRPLDIPQQCRIYPRALKCKWVYRHRNVRDIMRGQRCHWQPYFFFLQEIHIHAHTRQ